MDFVKARVQRVTVRGRLKRSPTASEPQIESLRVVFQSALPGLVDQKEITAALRQCNYDPEEVISVYLAMFGDVLLQASSSGDHDYADSFRSAANAAAKTDEEFGGLEPGFRIQEHPKTGIGC